MDCVYCSYVPPSSPPATSAAPRIHSVPQACNSACLGCCLLSRFSRILPRAWGRVGLHTWQGQAIVPGEWDGTLVPSSCPVLSGWSWPGREPVQGQSQGDLWQQSRSKPKRRRAARGQSPSSHPVAKAPSGTWAAGQCPTPRLCRTLDWCSGLSSVPFPTCPQALASPSGTLFLAPCLLSHPQAWPVPGNSVPPLTSLPEGLRGPEELDKHCPGRSGVCRAQAAQCLPGR